jgi:GTP-binding protein Era
VGKSSLLNALLDAEIAITSSRPETTRKAIRGILTKEFGEDGGVSQIIFVDTPGIHRPRTLLGKRLNSVVDEQLTTVDIILWLTPADEKLGRGDKYILEHLVQIANNKIPLICVVTKIDKVSKLELIQHIDEVSKLADFKEIIPVSAKTDENLEVISKVLVDLLPAGPLLYDKDQSTDESWQNMCTEIVRGAALEDLENELPHSLTVQFIERVEDTIYLSLFIERDSQKGIIIGKGGERIAKIRKRSERIVRQMLGEHIHLNLKVKVAKNWQSDPKLLEKLGY